MDLLLPIIISSFLVSLISFSGGLLLIIKHATLDKTAYLVSFAAGVMLTVAFLDILPEAAESASEPLDIFLPTFLAIVMFFFLERFVLWFHHHDASHDDTPSLYLILIGDGLHNFIDGIAIAASFLSNPALGVTTTLAMAAHEIPQEIADFSVLISKGMKKTYALFVNFISALTALIGAVVGYFFLDNLQAMLPSFLAFTAGMFIYISCSDLIPELHKDFKKQKSWNQSIPFILGIVILWFSVKLLEG